MFDKLGNWLQKTFRAPRHISIPCADRERLMAYLEQAQFAFEERVELRGGGHSTLSDGTSYQHQTRREAVRRVRDLKSPIPMSTFNQNWIGEWGWGTSSFFASIEDSRWHRDAKVSRRFRKQVRKSWRRLWRTLKQYAP